jgi:hypothetical protein
MTTVDYSSLSLEELFKLGSVCVQNVGPSWVVIDFSPVASGYLYSGEGAYLLAALASLAVKK